MAITWADLQLWDEINKRNLLPTDLRYMLEIGQANWYGDVDAKEVMDDPPDDLFDVARVYWEKTIRPYARVAIDMHGKYAYTMDLNVVWNASPFERVINVLVNTGTLEHVFDQRSAWENCHNSVSPGGIMVHNLPWVGWNDHGLYNYQPGFVCDLARENDYTIELAAYSSLTPRMFILATEEVREVKYEPDQSIMIHVVLRKPNEHKPFKSPMQGCYR